MPKPEDLRQALTDALGQVLGRLGASPDADADLPDLLARYARVKAERGRAEVAVALGLDEAELGLFDVAMRDVERTGRAAVAGGDGGERNLRIAHVRLLSWLETVGQRVPELALKLDVEAIASEEVGRKEVRALELVLRSLITESYGDQDALVRHLRDALSEKVVEKWRRGADAEDILSGCTFSELASLFVSKQEFDRYERLYEGTPYLTLLKEKRRTIQRFLDDTRRIRNGLAHNRKVSDVQLTLLDLYYEELTAPVQAAHDQGETKVDPGVYLDASKEELEQYFQTLSEDVQDVKDDLGELRKTMLASLGEIHADTQEIKATTRGIDKKLVFALVGVAIVIVGVALALLQGSETQDEVEETRASAERAEEVVTGTAKEVADIRETTEASAETTERIAERVEEQAEATKEVAEKIDEQTGATKELAEATRGVAEKVEEATEATKEAAAEMRESTERVAQTLEELRDGFRALTQEGGIIADATRPQEHYHNARLYEQRGDALKAMQSYRSYVAFPDLEFVDPHLRYQALLKLQQGLPAAREAYYDLKQKTPGLVAEFAWHRLLPEEPRWKGLEAFIEEHPDFAPAHYELSRDVSVARLGTQSMADKREEKKLLTRFLALHEEGRLLPHFLDPSVADQQLEDAKERLARLGALSDAVLQNPVSIVAYPSSRGWDVTVTIADTATEIFYRFGKDGAFKSTGHQSGIVTQAGYRQPEYLIQVTEAKRTLIQIQYKDARGRIQGPYDVLFDPEAKRLEGAKRMLGLTKRSWLSLREFDGKLLMYWSHLLGQLEVLTEVRYGLDREEPDTVLPIRGGDIDVGNLPYMSIPKATRFVTVQLLYTDGTASEIVTIRR